MPVGFDTLSELLSRPAIKQITTGESGASVYYLEDLSAYLKVASSTGPSDLLREQKVLEWLEGKLSVPRVLGFEERGGDYLMLLSEMAGTPASEYASNLADQASVEQLIEKSAVAMRHIHELSIADCPFLDHLDVKLAKAPDNIDRGFVDETDFDKENLGRTAYEVYAELIANRPPNEDLVFTHGDLCLPNYMMLEGSVSGFIDLERGGVADRYQDIALFLRSFAFNADMPVDAKEIFATAYGIERLDDDKLYYYRMLDELF